MGKRFTKAYENDKLYGRAASFLIDVQIWLLGVLRKYFRDVVLHYDYTDFMKAMKEDLLPLIGEVGLYTLENWQKRLKEKNKTEKRKQVLACIDIVKKVLENHGLQHFERESKYHLINRFSPKKFPDQKIKRSHVPHLYSFLYYARPEYFENLKKQEENAAAVEFRQKS